MNSLLIEVMPHGIRIPEYQTEGSAGFDLQAAINDPIKLWPCMKKLIPTGLRMCIPQGFEGQVRPRSGMAHKNFVTVLNAPGTIDSDYRGEIGVILVNMSLEESVTINRGDRIAQMVIAPYARLPLVNSSELGITERGAGGFGSTGVG